MAKQSRKICVELELFCTPDRKSLILEGSVAPSAPEDLRFWNEPIPKVSSEELQAIINRAAREDGV